MFNLLDLMRAAQGGAAMENMSRQFGLSLDQTRRSMEALMPAFALGFQRNAADPTGFANLLRMMGSGQYAGFFEQPGMAFSPLGRREGDTILGQLFGPEVSRQVANQAAAWAGVGPDIMRQMMPTVATMLMGGLFKSAASEGLADMFEQFAKVLRGGAAAAAQGRRNGGGAATDPFSAWASMVGAMWGGPPSSPAPAKLDPPSEGMPLNPFAPWAAMMAGALGGRAEPPTPEPPERARAAGRRSPLQSVRAVGRDDDGSARRPGRAARAGADTRVLCARTAAGALRARAAARPVRVLQPDDGSGPRRAGAIPRQPAKHLRQLLGRRLRAPLRRRAAEPPARRDARAASSNSTRPAVGSPRQKRAVMRRQKCSGSVRYMSNSIQAKKTGAA